VFARYTLAFALQLKKKHEKTCQSVSQLFITGDIFVQFISPPTPLNFKAHFNITSHDHLALPSDYFLNVFLAKCCRYFSSPIRTSVKRSVFSILRLNEACNVALQYKVTEGMFTITNKIFVSQLSVISIRECPTLESVIV
jgi:hypothetical protein